MSSDKKTPQLEAWSGAFGHEYLQRNRPDGERLRASLSLWAGIMRSIAGDRPSSLLEVGANIGINLRALRALITAEMFALEPNAEALKRLVDDGVVPAANAIEGQAMSIPLADSAVDMVFTSGVLIHIHPDHLVASMREIHRVARRYIVFIEYFADKPEMVPYRGQDNLLFKCDFGSLWLDSFSDLRVIDYGFAWRRLTGLDNVTWWLLNKVR